MTRTAKCTINKMHPFLRMYQAGGMFAQSSSNPQQNQTMQIEPEHNTLVTIAVCRLTNAENATHATAIPSTMNSKPFTRSRGRKRTRIRNNPNVGPVDAAIALQFHWQTLPESAPVAGASKGLTMLIFRSSATENGERESVEEYPRGCPAFYRRKSCQIVRELDVHAFT